MPYYPPLHMPKPPEPAKSLAERLRESVSLQQNSGEESLLNQIRVREPIPVEEWRDDDRALLARELASIIADVLQWPNYHFIPEDPIKWVTYVIGGDDLEHTEIAMRIEEELGYTFTNSDVDLFEQGTFGDFVDHILDGIPGFRKTWALTKPYPTEGRGSLESRPCPTLAVFLDLRLFLQQSRFKNSKRRVGLHMLVRRLPGKVDQLDLHKFVCRRFGLDTSPLAFDESSDGIALGLTATVLSTLPFVLMCAFTEILQPIESDHSMWFLPAFIAAFGLGITGLFSSPRIFRGAMDAVRGTRRKKCRTIRDLVEWIVEERSNVSDVVQEI